jgi:hypothetical protein
MFITPVPIFRFDFFPPHKLAKSGTGFLKHPVLPWFAQPIKT